MLLIPNDAVPDNVKNKRKQVVRRTNEGRRKSPALHLFDVCNIILISKYISDIIRFIQQR